MWLSSVARRRGGGGRAVIRGATRQLYSTNQPRTPTQSETLIRIMLTRHLARNTVNQLQGRLARSAGVSHNSHNHDQKHPGGPALTEPCHMPSLLA